MKADEQRAAQQRVNRIAAFRAELKELESEGVLVLRPDQRSVMEAHLEAVLARLAGQFEIDLTESARRISWGMRLASLLGVVAFAAALVLFLHRIWGGLPSWGHIGVLGGMPLLLLGVTEFAIRRGVPAYYVSLLALAAGAAFVTQMTVMGALFNLAPSPHALLAWAAFAILVAYAHGGRLLLGCGLGLLCGYGGALGAVAGGGYWSDLQPEGCLVVALVLYVIPWWVRSADPHDFQFVYRWCGAAGTLVALLTLSKTGDLCCSVVSARSMELMYQLVGLAVSAAVLGHGLRLGRAGLVNLGAVAFVVFLLVRLHAWWWGWMPKYLFFFLIGITAIVLVLLFRRIRLRLAEGRSA